MKRPKKIARDMSGAKIILAYFIMILLSKRNSCLTAARKLAENVNHQEGSLRNNVKRTRSFLLLGRPRVTDQHL